MKKFRPAHFIFFFYSIIIFSFFLFYLKNNSLNTKQQTLRELNSLANKSNIERKAYHVFLKKYNKPTNGIDLSNITFLNDEKMKIQTILKEEKNCEELKTRLNFLQNDNFLSFKETLQKKNDYMQEFLLQLQKPLELNNEDLEKLILLIENPKKSSSPQLIINNIAIGKSKTALNNNVLLLTELEILKREFYI